MTAETLKDALEGLSGLAEDQLLTPRETAVVYRVTVKTLRNWRQKRMGPKPTWPSAGEPRYRVGDVRAHIRSCIGWTASEGSDGCERNAET